MRLEQWDLSGVPAMTVDVVRTRKGWRLKYTSHAGGDESFSGVFLSRQRAEAAMTIAMVDHDYHPDEDPEIHEDEIEEEE